MINNGQFGANRLNLQYMITQRRKEQSPKIPQNLINHLHGEISFAVILVLIKETVTAVIKSKRFKTF